MMLYSCSATKHVLKEDESLLVANNIILNNYQSKSIDDKSSFKSDIAKQVVYNQQPNKKFLNFFRLKLGIYAMSYRKTQKLINKDKQLYETDIAQFKAQHPKSAKKLEKKDSFFEGYAGEKPVLFDSSYITASKERMHNYLFYKGYFDNQIFTSFRTKNKKTVVSYSITPNKAYTYRKIYRICEDSSLVTIIKKDSTESYIKENELFDIDFIKKERSRLAELIQNEGYYTFSPDFIILKIDSTIGNNQIDAYLVVKNEIDASLHKKYVYLDVNLNVNYDDKYILSQLKRTDRTQDTICNVNYNIVRNTVVPKILSRSLRIKPNDVYSLKEQTNTKTNLYGLGIFKYVNIKHEPFSFSPEEMGLITSIECIPAKRHTFSNQLELNTNAQSTLGFSLSGTYVNKNVFNSAAKLYASVRSGVDFQLQQRSDNGVKLSPVNSVNLNAEAKISFARIFPSFKKNTCKSYEQYKPKTNISVNYNYQKRILLYAIHTINLNYGYEWYNDNFRHLLSPIGFTYVRPNNISDSFQTRLNSSSILARSFESQFILGQDYTFFYTNQKVNIGNTKNTFTLRANINLAGNLLYAFAKIGKMDKSKPLTLSRIPFAQYARFEVEPKYFFNLKKNQSLGFRFFGGIGIPYGNSAYNNTAVMPYIKQFIAGGPNSLRAWVFRQIGPGGYAYKDVNVSQLDQTGDIKLEWNVEYRFNLYKLFKGAIFSDAGNIWMLKKDDSRPDAEFNFKRFGKEIAWDVGAGIRMDLSFFIIRFDVALPLYDPGYGEDIRWINSIVNYRNEYYEQRKLENPSLTKKTIRKNEIGRLVNYNIAIGYPF